MSKILTQQVLNKISRYFLKLGNHLTMPESRCMPEIVTGILKVSSVLANKIAGGLNDDISLSQTTQRFRKIIIKKVFP